MRKIYLLTFLPLLVLALASTSYGWQGRMGGMGDPYGLLSDESDFLIHPAKITKGEGVKFYGNYRFIYTGVTDWDYDLDVFDTAGTLLDYNHLNGSGDEYKHDALLGAAFPLGPGRLGLFFEYAGKRGNYDGAQDILVTPSWGAYDLTSDLDNFALRLLYGLPVGSLKLGGEVQFAYRQEENKALYNYTDGSELWKNFFWDGMMSNRNLFPLMLPYDSRYWEALFKGSLEGKVGPLALEFTLRSGFLFGGDNQYEYEHQEPIGTPTEGFRLKGDVTGWRIGGDLWARYPLAQDLSLPFLVRIDFQEKTRDGDGPGQLGFAGDNFEYKSQEQSLGITVGGGVDKELSKGAKIAAGIYYNYLQGTNDIQVSWYQLGVILLNYDYSGFPDSTEHQVVLRLAGELELSPAVTLRMGLAPFYGWVREDFKFTYLTSANPYTFTDDVSADGYHWGIGASLGGTIKFKPLTLEPFVVAGYEELALNGDGYYVQSVGPARLYVMDLTRRAWYIGGGFSVLFNL
ncbi:MAG: hypothetical protein MUO24_01740 [Desulfobacterales bacterium]|nr:hypothetical protein [Desulfobacterales bacterium]